MPTRLKYVDPDLGGVPMRAKVVDDEAELGCLG
jgi:hypothetical protein